MLAGRLLLNLGKRERGTGSARSVRARAPSQGDHEASRHAAIVGRHDTALGPELRARAGRAGLGQCQSPPSQAGRKGVVFQHGVWDVSAAALSFRCGSRRRRAALLAAYEARAAALRVSSPALLPPCEGVQPGCPRIRLGHIHTAPAWRCPAHYTFCRLSGTSAAAIGLWVLPARAS